MEESFLIKKLEERKQQNAFRQLRLPDTKVDFCSNDYLGIVKNGLIDENNLKKKTFANSENHLRSGSTGSRLLTGNYPLIEEVETEIARFHDAACALIFNSGYDANTGLLSCVAGRGDTIIYDHLSHASIRDGIRLSLSQAFSFRHNDLDDLHQKMQIAAGNIFVVTESVFSMDGDKAPLKEIAEVCNQHNAHLIVDEAHATGVVGNNGEGLVQLLRLQRQCFARIHTFGKACGVHGAAVLGSGYLRQYLINFSRAFMYTTALPEASIAAIRESYKIFPHLATERIHLQKLITRFQSSTFINKLLLSETPVQGVVIPGNEHVKSAAEILQNKGFDVRPILYPSVPKGAERLRIVLHAFNSEDEINEMVNCLVD